MLFQRDRIIRSYQRPLFHKRNPLSRLIFMGVMLTLIIGIPVFTSWQFSAVQLVALDAIGYAPTATPFASDRAYQAQARYLAGDVQGAADLYAVAAQLQPDNPAYLYEYGMLLIELDRQNEAAELGRTLITLYPNDPRGYALQSNALMWSDPVAAIPIAITGIELGIPFAPLNSALAVAYTQIGRYGEAAQRGDLAVRINPMDASARRSYSYPLIFTARYNEAIEQLEQAIAINPNLTGPYFELASLYRRLENEEMAIAIYERVLELDPQNTRAYLRICETLASRGLFDEGSVFCDTALEIDPTFASAHRMSGQLSYNRRNYEGAIESFEQCIALGSDEIECYYLRGLAHFYLNQCDDAWTILNDALLRTDQEVVVINIETGLRLITQVCAGYQNRQIPTPIPPTPIPPTPIGGF